MIKVFISCNLYPDKEVKSVKLYYEKKLPHYFLKMNILPIVLHPSSIKDIKKIFDIYHPDLLVLSGGNTPSIYEKRYKEISKLRDDFETKLIKFFLSKRKPILGICRGMQFLNLFFGGKLSKLNNHAGTMHNIITNSNYSKYFPKLVNSYHKYGIKKMMYRINFYLFHLIKIIILKLWHTIKKIFMPLCGIQKEKEKIIKNLKNS